MATKSESDLIEVLMNFVHARTRANFRAKEIFRAVRKTLSLSQVAMANRLGITNVYLNYIEHGTKLPSPELFERLYGLLPAPSKSMT